jgi:hypothetical protein
MHKLKALLVAPLIFIAFISNAQVADSLSMITGNVKGQIFVYDARRLTIDQFPPSAVSIAVSFLDGNKLISYDVWQHNCRTEEYKIGNGNFKSIREVGIVSATFFMHKAFCGIKDDEGFWFHLARRNLPLEPLFMNLDTVKKTSKPVDGVSVLFKPGSINYDPIRINFSSQNSEEVVFDCTIERYFFKQEGAYVEASLKNGDALYAARYNLCKGVYSNLSTSKNTEPMRSTVAPIQGIDAAKSRCVDLGFKAGTENFGKCVLQLIK